MIILELFYKDGTVEVVDQVIENSFISYADGSCSFVLSGGITQIVDDVVKFTVLPKKPSELFREWYTEFNTALEALGGNPVPANAAAVGWNAAWARRQDIEAGYTRP